MMKDFIAKKMNGKKVVGRDQNPLNLICNKSLKYFLTFVGAWPDNIYDEKRTMYEFCQRWIITFQAVTVILGQMYYIKQHNSELTLLEVGDLYIPMFVTSLGLLRVLMTLFKEYHKVCKYYYENMNLIHFRSMGPIYENTHKRIDKVSNYFSITLWIMMLGALSMFNLTPMYNNYRDGAYSKNKPENVTYQLSVYYQYGSITMTDYYWTVSAINLYFSVTCSIYICGMDLMCLLIVFQLIGHIEILRYNCQHFPKPAVKNITSINFVVKEFSEEDNNVISEKLKECINHYRLIANFTDDISSCFGPMLASNYMYQFVSCCLLLLECSSGGTEAIFRYLPLTLIIFGQLILGSSIFEVLCSKSETLKDAIYDMPWESMNVSNQRVVCFFLHRLQTPVQFTALGMATVGVQTMVQILKTTFSYFTFLRTFS